MSIPTNSHDETKPAGGRDINLGDNDIREFKTQAREIIAVDHKMESSGQGADWGKHNTVSLLEQADLGTGEEGKPILGAQTVDGKAELVFTDEDDNDVQITSGGKIKLSAGRLENDTYLVGRNNADDGDINIIKVNTSDELVLGAVTTLPDTSKLATSGAPTADAQIANKKYVDDNDSDTQVSLGSWTSKSNNTVYQASTDGFVTATTVVNSGRPTLDGYTDGSNPPTTKLFDLRDAGPGDQNSSCSLTMPVKSGDYWKVNGSGTNTIYWIPLGL